MLNDAKVASACFYVRTCQRVRNSKNIATSIFQVILLFVNSTIKQKSQFTRHLLRKLGNFSRYNFNFCPNFSSLASKFGNFQLTSPQIWKFSVHKPPNLDFQKFTSPSFRGKYQFIRPTLRKSGPHTPT